MRWLLPSGLPVVCAAAPIAALSLASGFAVGSPQKAPPASTASLDKTVQPFFAKHCAACHNAKVSSSGLNLEDYKTVASLAKDPHTWENIAAKIRTGQMPPPGSPRPPAAEAKAVAAWITGELERAEKSAKPNPGRVTARRLNRAEYNNTVRDLLGVQLRPADDFPQDDSGYGFDNIGDVLSLSPPLMEKYLTAAERVARTAIFGPEPLKPALTEIRMPRRDMKRTAEVPMEYDRTGLTFLNAAHAVHRFPVDAEYGINIVLTGERPLGSEPMKLGLWIDGKMVQQIEYDPEGTASFELQSQELAGQTARFPKVRIPAGDHWVAVSMLRMYEGLPPSFGGPNPSKRPIPQPRQRRGGRPPQEPPADATPEQIAEFKARQEEIQKRIAEFQKQAAERQKTLANAARLFVLEIGGPFEQATGPSAKSRALLYTCGHTNGVHKPGCEKKIVTDFARRAFRRPVTAKEVEPYIRLVGLAKKNGDSFEEGLCVAVQAILVSPHFLFRIEKDTPTTAASKDGARPLTDHELASRLSYFLWSSMPDAELMRCADNRTLRKPQVLDAQVRRMLRDPKAQTLAENFAGQWLELRKLESQKPDLDKFPAFDEYLRLSMRRETELFFNNIVREDRPVLDFLDANYTFVNERLAKLYGMPGVSGPEFRKVALTGGNRGGILTQASVLTVSSYSTRTSPVLRGKWILDNILNTPPPPPPPDVPSLDETKIGAGMSLRQQLEEHRKNALCASCHSRLDPLGFALENYDAIGAWREKDGTVPIEATGTLPNGKSFNGPKQLKAILKTDKDAFVLCITEKLLTYALGRGIERYDRPTVKTIAARVAKDDYRFSRLVLEIAGSLPFQQRKGPSTQ
jgi:mono/diheme cytochrome c family protein